MNNGYIKLYRSILDNPTTMKDAEHLAIWIYLLLNAARKEKDVMFKGKRITLKPGQLTTGRKIIAKSLHVSELKVQRILTCYESAHQIEQQTSNKCRLITIVKWQDYQIIEQQNVQQLNNNCTTTEQQLNTKQEYKNNKNIRSNKEIKEKYVFKKPSLEELQKYIDSESLSNTDANQFFDYYESNGWKVGKSSMKDWKAAARNWNRRNAPKKSQADIAFEEYDKLYGKESNNGN